MTLLVTCAVAFFAVIAWCAPSVAEAAEDRASAVETGAVWRVLTGHLTHRSLAHLLLNLGLFVPLAATWERRHGSRSALLACIVLALGVAAGIRLHPAPWESYRGLSGIVYGLIVLVLLDTGHERRASTAALLIVTAIIAKTALEAATGAWVAGGAANGTLGVRLLPGSHLGGIVAALAVLALRPLGTATAADGRRTRLPAVAGLARDP